MKSTMIIASASLSFSLLAGCVLTPTPSYPPQTYYRTFPVNYYYSTGYYNAGPYPVNYYPSFTPAYPWGGVSIGYYENYGYRGYYGYRGAYRGGYYGGRGWGGGWHRH